MIDTKLARETKRGIVLQLCLYADLLGPLQGGARHIVMWLPHGPGMSHGCIEWTITRRTFDEPKAAL